MALLVLLCAAIVSTGAVLVVPSTKNIRVRQLAVAYWAVMAVLLAAALVDSAEEGRLGIEMFLHFDRLSEHAAIGVLVAAVVLIAWTIFCLFNGFGRTGDNQ
ncbi:hypothetical protein [Paratractidigestivibacter sp.]|uniref:hypothetical protein n=1 Tax=Paratractidigestivibacter sp. TaxID=2847316 RepID=UPI002ABD74C8|nr:hypothetical protein [Paratractidigestivibacter sp.]